MRRHHALDAMARKAPPWLIRLVPLAVKNCIKRMLATRDRGDTGTSQSPHVLEREHLLRAEYETLWRRKFADRPANSLEYLQAHRERYYELFNSLNYLLRGRPRDADVLEVGVSEYLSLYKSFFPDIRLATLDRPLTDNGADEGWSKQIGNVDRHYNANLNAEALSPAWGNPPLGQFDLIVCTEVIEHLVVNPVEFLEGLIGLLKARGLLYLTTPNFFRFDNLEKIDRRENPLAVYPRRGGNWDAHHHFREFSMDELVRFAEEAGGKIFMQYFSACWDGPAVRRGTPSRRSNLVLVIGPRDPPGTQG